jgi:Domain of unknown function (DUF4270)
MLQKTLGLLCSVTLLFSACKENKVLNPDLIPAVDNISTFFTDTITIIANNRITDSINTGLKDGRKSSSRGMGTISDDPIFGATWSALSFQLRIPKANLSFPGTGKIADSLMLSIPFIGTYGDTTLSAPLQTFNVYRLNDAMDVTKPYYNNAKLSFNPAILGSTTIRLSKMDTLQVDSAKVIPQLRIRLSDDLRDSLLFKLSDVVEYKDNASFNKWFKGLHITPADTFVGRNIGYFDLERAKMILYSRAVLDAVSGKLVRQYTDYYLDPVVNAYAMHLNRNYKLNNPVIKTYLNTNNSKGDSLLFLQSNYGSCFDIDLKGMQNFSNQNSGKIAINKAEFEFTVAPSGFANSDSTYRTPSGIIAYGVDSFGNEFEFKDDIEGSSFVLTGGLREFVYQNGLFVTRYRVNLIRTIQKAMATKNFNFKIRIKANSARFGTGRVVFYAPNKINNKSKFNLIYTKI